MPGHLGFKIVCGRSPAPSLFIILITSLTLLQIAVVCALCIHIENLTAESMAKSARPRLMVMKGREPIIGNDGGPSFSWWKLNIFFANSCFEMSMFHHITSYTN